MIRTLAIENYRSLRRVIVPLAELNLVTSPEPIGGYDSMLSEFADPQRAPEILTLRERIRSWRFHDYFWRRSSARREWWARRCSSNRPGIGPSAEISGFWRARPA